MLTPERLTAVRRRLRPIGFAMPSIGLSAVPPVQQQIEAARRLEAAGYRNGWANEGVGGKDVFVQIAILLGATDQLTFGTSVTPMWARPPMVTHAAAHQLVEAFPDRFLLGLGSGYDFMAPLAGLVYRKPLAQLREYVTRMPEPVPLLDVPAVDYPTVVGANGRRSVRQAGEIADGAFPSLVPPRYVEEIRSVLGDDKLIIVGLMTFVDDDEEKAKGDASQSISQIFAMKGVPYGRVLDSFGYTAQDRTEGSDRLTADLTAAGSGATIAAAARRYIEAGPDHVVLMPVEADFNSGVDKLESIAADVTAV
ncbi:LLM class flavin-dependent oxidoreductase [Mycolicibacterium sp.]|uniref:LLM class flavin-dependent oxidoreductase n=1 Tax=Mycolicibacterium sp. TaxID=2320850 RepID=UPI0037C6F6B5